MLRKYAPYAALGLLIAALLAAYLWRTVTIQADGTTLRIQAGAWTSGQALQAAGVQLHPGDLVEPPANQLIPLNGQIRVQRAAQVWLWENGRLRNISGMASTPAGLLEQANIPLDSADRLLRNGQPLDAGAPLPSGQTIVLQVNRAATFILDQNGQRQKITSSRSSTAGALWDAGVRLGPGDLLSVPPESALTSGQIIGYQPARELILQVSGQQIRAFSNAATVGEALAGAGVALQGLDYAVPAEDQPLPADGQIRIVRVHETVSLSTTLLPFEYQVSSNAALAPAQRKVTRPGQAGVHVTRERARFEDNQEVKRGVDSDWTAVEPLAEKVEVGAQVASQSSGDSAPAGVDYWRSIRVYATSYSPCNLGTGSCGYTTSSGRPLAKGIIAVKLNWYRIIAGMQVYVPGYGTGVIADVGGGMPGRPWIDLGFDDESFASQAFVGWTTMYFLNPPPANTDWSLP